MRRRLQAMIFNPDIQFIKTMKKLFYTVPIVRELPLKIERGFAASLEDPITDPEIEW